MTFITIDTQEVEPDKKIRADVFLSTKFTQHSRAKIIEMIKSGQIKKDDQKIFKPSYVLRPNDKFIVYEENVSAQSVCSHLVPQEIPLEILYSDDDIAVINKPSGLSVHPGAGQKDNTLVNALLWHFPTMYQQPHSPRPGIVHRLDKHTSGLIVIAKNAAAHTFLANEFFKKRVRKIYKTFVWGDIPEHTFDMISGHVRHPKHRLKFFTGLEAPSIPNHNVRVAHSSFELVSKHYNISELKVRLHTGRTHQIRAHLSDRGFPIVGDELYGGKRAFGKNFPLELEKAINELNGQALHAQVLEFTHPTTKETMSFEANLPSNLQKLQDFFKK